MTSTSSITAGPPDSAPVHPGPAPGPEREEDVPLRGRRPLRAVLSGTVLLGLGGSLLLATMAVGAGGILITDPLITGGPLSWVRYGHGRDLATVGLYVGLGMLVWAWVRLGRDVLAGTALARHVLVASAAWITPMLLSPPLFTRDVCGIL